MGKNRNRVRSPAGKVHMASLANVLGIVIFYLYYRYLNPNPSTISFWQSSTIINILFFGFAVLPFVVIGRMTKIQRGSIEKIVQKEKDQWSSGEVSQILDYLFRLPRNYFLFSFFAWTFEGVLWGILSWIFEGGNFFSSFLSTVLGCVAAGTLAALFSYIIANKITRQEVVRIFPQLEHLNRPVNASLERNTLLILCVVGLMPVMMIGYLSYLHAEQVMLTQDLSILAKLRNINISIFIISVSITAMAMGWVTRNLSHPLVKMADMMKKVSTGDFSTRMSISTDDEIGYVSGGLNKMVAELSVLYQSLEKKVEERTKKLNIALSEVEQSNKKIMDSISYSERIQNSLLPNVNAIHQFLPQSFFLWMPRDVVGGDIYYAESFETGFTIAVIDCTGHGIPGALMTMIAASSLRRIIVDEGCLNPAEILKLLNSNVKKLLRQDGETTKSDDGLDASICYVNTLENKMTYAGAKLPLTYLHNGNFVTIKGDRQSIGYKKSDLDFEFRNHEIDIQDGMVFYLYTDGIVDQLGGDKRIPLGNRKFIDLLSKSWNGSFKEQQAAISDGIQSYKGDNDRQDDITVVGFSLGELKSPV